MYKHEDEGFITVLRTIAMPSDANPSGDIFGGWLLSQMDLAGGLFAGKISQSRITTVAVNAMTFHSPVFVGDEVSCYCKLIKVGNTSITLNIESWASSMFEGGIERKVTEGTFIYVAIGPDRKPIQVKRENINEN